MKRGAAGHSFLNATNLIFMSKKKKHRSRSASASPDRSKIETPKQPFAQGLSDSASAKRDKKGTAKGAKPLITVNGIREAVEAFAIAFTLAFLLRTFEAEAFVIPTGSMATTLMGRHLDTTCPKCGSRIRTSASEELNQYSGRLDPRKHVVAATCPNCGYTMSTSENPAYNGDRILVSKFNYILNEPKRWDVAVFHYPEDAKTNYIKRLVGLPEESIRIDRGNLLVKKADQEEADFEIARKSPEKLLAMMRTVYDNDHTLAETLTPQGWPARWQSEVNADGWNASSDYKTFSHDGLHDAQTAWLRYRHFMPTSTEWQWLEKGPLPQGYQPRPRLITDGCAYNSGIKRDMHSGSLGSQGLHWVGDLALECTLDIKNNEGEIVLQLVKGGVTFDCRLDVANGQAVLSIDGPRADKNFTAEATTPIRGPGTYAVRLANADDQLRLWVDGQVIPFDRPTTYGPLGNQTPTAADLAPVAIGARGVKLDVTHLKVLRDIYYIADRQGNHHHYNLITDFHNPAQVFRDLSQKSLADFYSDPSRWPDAFSEESMQQVEFDLAEDQFLMLGDNSPCSKDSRLWGGGEFYVHRDLLIGKALYIYWPHSWEGFWIGNTRIPFPFFPNVKDMGLVR